MTGADMPISPHTAMILFSALILLVTAIEQFWLKRIFWWFDALLMFIVGAVGIVLCAGSLLVSSTLLSALMGVGAFSCFWGIKEMAEQQERVRKGWFPRNPTRTYPWDDVTDQDKDK